MAPGDRELAARHPGRQPRRQGELLSPRSTLLQEPSNSQPSLTDHTTHTTAPSQRTHQNADGATSPPSLRSTSPGQLPPPRAGPESCVLRSPDVVTPRDPGPSGLRHCDTWIQRLQGRLWLPSVALKVKLSQGGEGAGPSPEAANVRCAFPTGAFCLWAAGFGAQSPAADTTCHEEMPLWAPSAQEGRSPRNSSPLSATGRAALRASCPPSGARVLKGTPACHQAESGSPRGTVGGRGHGLQGHPRAGEHMEQMGDSPSERWPQRGPCRVTELTLPTRTSRPKSPAGR